MLRKYISNILHYIKLKLLYNMFIDIDTLQLSRLHKIAIYLIDYNHFLS